MKETIEEYQGTESIPLTEQILKKNSFTLDYNDYHLWRCLRGNLLLRQWGREFGIHIKGTRIAYNTALCNIQYVHQLLQVLRLCGFDDLADNFKVE